ncbi:MAG: Two component multi-sensor signal transduction histidine kinase [Modestobacter sp.]|nr:Two component multi-sensor signal transduction histidine kinase [Modestobacter sp.]
MPKKHLAVVTAAPVAAAIWWRGRRPTDGDARGRIPDVGDKQLFIAACAVGVAALGVVVHAPAGSAWEGGAGGLLLLAAGLVAARATTSPRRRLLSARLDEAVERLTVQDAELARCAAILAATDDSIVTMSLDGVITDWNAAAAELYGYTRDEALGQPVTILGPAADPDVLDAMAGVVEGAPTSLEAAHLRRDGSTVQTSLILSRIHDRTGAASGIVAIARNIGEQKTRDAEFHQESKLESLGRLSAGLAHEINSPIQFVGDNARFLEEAYEELIRVVGVYRGLLDTSNPIGWMERQERVREAEATIDFDYLQKEIPSAVEQTLEGIDRVSTIVRAMKTFSHPGHKEQVPADLNEAVAATVTVTRHQISDVADLRLDLTELPPVRCNIADLNQVFLNLIVNAADAVEDTGKRGVITVATAVDGDDVIVSISDTGGGIPDDVRPKIFDPFFTTKDVGRGSGQGLPLARGVVQEGHGGSLTVDSVLGRGTTFAVRIPIDGLAREEPAGADPSSAGLR